MVMAWRSRHPAGSWEYPATFHRLVKTTFKDEIMDWITANWEHILLTVTSIVALAAHIAPLTPTVEDDKAVAWAKKLLDFIAGNYGNAKNQK